MTRLINKIIKVIKLTIKCNLQSMIYKEHRCNTFVIKEIDLPIVVEDT